METNFLVDRGIRKIVIKVDMGIIGEAFTIVVMVVMVQ